MVIDSHLHIGLNGWTEQTLLNYMDTHGIEKAWILTWDEVNPVVPMYYIPLDIELVRQAFRNHPDRIVPFYAPDPDRPDWQERLQECLNEGFAGCGELKVPYRWNDERMFPLLEFLDKHHLPLVFHMERARKVFIPAKEQWADWLFKRFVNERFNGKSARFIEGPITRSGMLQKYLEKRMIDFPGYLLDFRLLEDALNRYRHIRFISHGPHIWNHFSIPAKEYLFHQSGRISGKGILWKLLEQYDNFYCDLSGFSGFNALNRDRSFSTEFLDMFFRKVLFGTDNSDLGLMALLEGLGLDNKKLHAIFYANAEAITR